MGDPDAWVDALVQASFTAMAVLSALGAEHDLSLTQVRVLGILRDRRVKMSELAAYLGLERSTMSGLVERGERRGLLRRAPNETDGRAIDVMLTDDGAAFADRLTTDVHRSLAAAAHELTPSERRRLGTLLERMLHGSR